VKNRIPNCQRRLPLENLEEIGLIFATSTHVPLSVIPAPLSVQKMCANQRSALASGAQRPKMREE